MSNRTHSPGDRRRIVVLLSSELLHTKTSVNVQFLSELQKFLEIRVKHGERFLLVCGGEILAEEYQRAACACGVKNANVFLRLRRETSRLSALLVHEVLNDLVSPTILADPVLVQMTPKPILVGFNAILECCTDYVAVKFAKNYWCERLIKLSNLVCTGAMAVNANNQLASHDRSSWQEYLEKPDRRNCSEEQLVFCLLAAKQAANIGLTVNLLGNDLTNLDRYLDGKTFRGITLDPNVSDANTQNC